jgi:alkyldihydroxyacetonephosphate synthase
VTLTLDAESLLAQVAGDDTLDAIETELAARGLTLGVPLDGARGTLTVAAWLAAGAPGAPSSFADPADHLVAGLAATLPDGRQLVVHPGPRRAVGPDLASLALGTTSLATVTHAWLRVHRLGARRVALPVPGGDLDPRVSDAEARLVSAIARELAR